MISGRRRYRPTCLAPVCPLSRFRAPPCKVAFTAPSKNLVDSSGERRRESCAIPGVGEEQNNTGGPQLDCTCQHRLDQRTLSLAIDVELFLAFIPIHPVCDRFGVSVGRSMRRSGDFGREGHQLQRQVFFVPSRRDESQQSTQLASQLTMTHAKDGCDILGAPTIKSVLTCTSGGDRTGACQRPVHTSSNDSEQEARMDSKEEGQRIGASRFKDGKARELTALQLFA